MTRTILHITTFLQGGAGRILCTLAKYQRENGENVLVVLDDSPARGYESYPEYIRELVDGGIRVFTVNGIFRRDLAANLHAASVVRKMLVNEAVNIVHANAAIPALIGLIARSGLQRRIPILLSMQGWGNNKKPDQEFTDIATINLLDAVFPVSQAAAQLLIRKGVTESLLHVIPNGIHEKNAAEPDDDLVEKIRQWRAHGLRLIGCIGTLCSRKDQATLIRAIAKLGRPKVMCIFIGEGQYNDNLTELAMSLGIEKQVEFVGYRANAAGYLRYLETVVLPSRSEGLPLVILEAFREKTAVVGSDIPEITEVVRDGETGKLFRVGKVADLVRLLENVLDECPSIRRRRCETAYALFRDNFTADVMCQRYNRQYLLMLNR